MMGAPHQMGAPTIMIVIMRSPKSIPIDPRAVGYGKKNE